MNKLTKSLKTREKGDRHRAAPFLQQFKVAWSTEPVPFLARVFTLSKSLICSSLLLLVCSSSLCADDWPFIRGDSLATGVVSQPLGDQLAISWRKSVAESGFEATAVVLDGVVYVGDVDGTFYAIRLDDGETLWKQEFPDSGFLAGAAVKDGRVYVGDFNGVVRALSTESGDLLWSQEGLGEIYAAPNVVDDLVLVVSESGDFIALAVEDGAEQWRFEIDAPLRSWPTVVDGRVYLAGCDGKLHVVEVATGKAIDSVSIDGPTGSTPAVLDGAVLFGTEQGSFYSISLDPLEIRWRYQDPRASQSIRSAAAVTSRAIVFGNQARQVIALKPNGEEVLWNFPCRGAVESSPVIVGDSVFAATKRGRLHRLDLETGEELWHFDAGGSFQASPAVADGKLVIGNIDGTLYCFESQEE